MSKDYQKMKQAKLNKIDALNAKIVKSDEDLKSKVSDLRKSHKKQVSSIKREIAQLEEDIKALDALMFVDDLESENINIETITANKSKLKAMQDNSFNGGYSQNNGGY